ncbi:N-acyl-D-glucosamine 2-epimerase [Paenibacillus sp. YYML68]|uniref:N-acyl-D-glucosamine 2-epimerase n=1 Tax=Paenibacillus sp. YYML68 TaxID=2909250 RepID=UPI0024900EDA|nr:N-acyl-D-glucosamine 2-epimerase [Paenibacillus sp. YYML68]
MSKLRIEPTIQIDPTFAYYVDRSEASVAAELRQAGYRAVRYFITDDTEVNGPLVQALVDQGIEVWAMTLGNGTYRTANMPSDWRSWRMELLKPVNDGFERLSPFSDGYTRWKKAALSKLLRTYPFSGVDIAECYFPEWNGLSTGIYGDIGPHGLEAFRRFSGGHEMPEFRNKRSPRYYKNDRSRYALWVECRVESVNRLVDELVNGVGGIRDSRRDVRVATWSLAINAGRSGPATLRELQGLDACAMIRLVKPDAHMLQTHWPDWTKLWLTPSYVGRYEPYLSAIRSEFPQLPVGIQTDIGSLPHMRRSASWLRRFAHETMHQHYSFWTAYEYSIGRSMYTEPPLPLSATRVSLECLLISFSKRIDPDSAAVAAYYVHWAGNGSRQRASVSEVSTDGHQLLLRSMYWPPGRFELEISGVRDTPERWLVKGQSANVTPGGSVVRVEGC